MLSLCAGDGRDLIGVLQDRPDAGRVSAVLVELHPELAQRTRDSAMAAGLTRITVPTENAGTTDAYADAAPADLVLRIGIGMVRYDGPPVALESGRRLFRFVR